MQKGLGSCKRLLRSNGKFYNIKPDDFVIATGKQYSIKEFIEIVSSQLDENSLKGKGINEKDIEK